MFPEARRVAATESNVRERHEWPIRQEFRRAVILLTSKTACGVAVRVLGGQSEGGQRVFIGIT